MKSVGIVRKIDNLGRVVIPKELRKTMDMDPKDPIEIFVEEDKVILQKYQRGCMFCGNVDDLEEYKGKHICKSCATEIKDQLGKDEE